MAASSGFDLGLFAGIRLDEFIKMGLVAPPATEIVELDLTAGEVDPLSLATERVLVILFSIP